MTSRHYNDYYHDFYGNGQRVVQVSHHRAAPAVVREHHDVVTTTVHEDAAIGHAGADYGGHFTSHAVPAVPGAAVELARIQQAEGGRDEEYEYPDEQVEEVQF